MRVVLDTNVFVSGVFFNGPPYEILKAWRDGKIQLVMSADIFEEYQRVGEELAAQFPGVELGPILALVVVRAAFSAAPSLPEPVCDDPDDDKFIACALAGGCELIISGDNALVRTSGYQGISVLRPRQFIERYLAN